MAYRVRGLDPAPFRRLYGLPEAELAREGVRRLLADPRTACLHAHYARHGCFAARIERP